MARWQHRWTWTLAAAGILGAVVGCGQSASRPATAKTSSPKTAHPAPAPASTAPAPTRTYIEGGTPYAGAKNLQHYVSLAKAHPNNVNDLINAAKAEFVNQNPEAALSYYQQAVKVDPQNGELYNNIGNIYYRSLNQPKTALPYYQKAVQLSPHYDYGWYNLVLLEQQLGNAAEVKSIAAQALKEIPPSDKLYPYLKKFSS